MRALEGRPLYRPAPAAPSATNSRVHGGMAWPERERQVEHFRNPAGARYLVATDAAGEGINLQFCAFMANYDIPWNPARLEQRMGRIHRYGQKRDVRIVNLAAGSTSVQPTWRPAAFGWRPRTAPTTKWRRSGSPSATSWRRRRRRWRSSMPRQTGLRPGPSSSSSTRWPCPPPAATRSTSTTERVEQIAVRTAVAWEEDRGAVVQDVSKPALARAAGLPDSPRLRSSCQAARRRSSAHRSEGPPGSGRCARNRQRTDPGLPSGRQLLALCSLELRDPRADHGPHPGPVRQAARQRARLDHLHDLPTALMDAAEPT